MNTIIIGLFWENNKNLIWILMYFFKRGDNSVATAWKETAKYAFRIYKLWNEKR